MMMMMSNRWQTVGKTEGVMLAAAVAIATLHGSFQKHQLVQVVDLQF